MPSPSTCVFDITSVAHCDAVWGRAASTQSPILRTAIRRYFEAIDARRLWTSGKPCRRSAVPEIAQRHVHQLTTCTGYGISCCTQPDSVRTRSKFSFDYRGVFWLAPAPTAEAKQSLGCKAKMAILRDRFFCFSDTRMMTCIAEKGRYVTLPCSSREATGFSQEQVLRLPADRSFISIAEGPLYKTAVRNLLYRSVLGSVCKRRTGCLIDHPCAVVCPPTAPGTARPAHRARCADRWSLSVPSSPCRPSPRQSFCRGALAWRWTG